MIKAQIKQHLMLVICVGISLLLIFTGAITKGGAQSSRNEAYALLTDTQNKLEIAKQNRIAQKTLVVYEVSGLDVERKKADDEAMLAWISPAFTFKNGDEYNEHREKYVERLGENDEFVVNIMPPYIPSNVDADGYILNPDGTYKYDKNGNKMKVNFNLKIKEGSFTSFVAKIDEEEDLYEYVTFFTTSSDSAFGYEGSAGQRVIITYTMDKDHNPHSFRCQLESTVN